MNAEDNGNLPETADMVAITRLIKLPFCSESSPCSSKCIICVNSSYTSFAWVPMTIWYCPPFSTTWITAGIADIFAVTSAEGVSFSTKRSLVAQCAALTIFSSPMDVIISLASLA